MVFKPMLAAKADLDKIQFPVMVSPKLDGIRCLIVDGQAVTRSLKPIKNDAIRKELSKPEYTGLDGEIVTMTPDGRVEDFNTVQSKVMSADKDPGFWVFVVFDDFTSENEGFADRLDSAREIVKSKTSLYVVHLRHEVAEDFEALNKMIDRHVRLGYEGTMVRDPNGPYKHGRSTVNQGWLLKIKEFHDDEAFVVAVEELMHNDNEATTNALGHTERSSHAENKRPGDTMGKLVVQWGDKEFSIGTGFTQAQRQEIWDDRENYIGRRLTFRYQEVSHLGVPRFPSFMHFRDDE